MRHFGIFDFFWNVGGSRATPFLAMDPLRSNRLLNEAVLRAKRAVSVLVPVPVDDDDDDDDGSESPLF